MGRRRNESLFEVVAKLPWKVGVGLSAASFIGIRYVLPLFHMPGYETNPFAGMLDKALHTSQLFNNFSLLVSFVFLAAAGISFLSDKTRGKLLNSQTGLESIKAMSWRQFELLVSEAYRRQGYAVTETGQGGPDGGIDLILSKAGEKTIVQCKQWRTYSVGVSVMRETFGILVSEGAIRAKIVTCGAFTNDAKEFARGKPIDLVDGPALLALVKDVQSQPNVSHLRKSSTPHCPSCNGPMAMRKSREARMKYWSCKKFPACGGIRRIS